MILLQILLLTAICYRARWLCSTKSTLTDSWAAQWVCYCSRVSWIVTTTQLATHTRSMRVPSSSSSSRLQRIMSRACFSSLRVAIDHATCIRTQEAKWTNSARYWAPSNSSDCPTRQEDLTNNWPRKNVVNTSTRCQLRLRTCKFNTIKFDKFPMSSGISLSLFLQSTKCVKFFK